MQNYELLFILPGTMSEDEAAPVVEKVKKAVADNAGVGWDLEAMEKRRLAYPMKHIRYGYFYLAFFHAEQASAVKIQNELRLMPGLLRALVAKFNPEKQKMRKIDFGMIPASASDAFTAPVKPAIEMQALDVAANIGPAAIVAPEQAEAIIEPVQEEKIAVVKKIKKPVDLADIDKKLDEILDLDLSNV